MRLDFIKAYCQTILEIIEEQPNYTIPLQLYQIIILVYFLQLQGYVLTNQETKLLYDEKISSAARANEVASLTFLLYSKGNDALTIVFFIIIQVIVYSYFLYVGVLSFLRNKKRYIYAKYSSTFKVVNQVLNTYFTLYDWIFLIPVMEMNFGLIFCGRRSFLTYQRVNGCYVSPLLEIFGYLGACLGFITSLITSFFFRNYQFEEANKLKRKYNKIMIVLLILKCGLSLVYYLDFSFSDSLKYVLSIAIATISIMDSVWNIPFRDRGILRFYAMCSSFYFCICLLSTIWIFGKDLINGDELFYYIIIFSTVCLGIVLSISENRYESILKGNFADKDSQNQSSILPVVDVYLEQLMILTMESTHNEQSKCRLIELMHIHFLNCTDTHCLCKKSDRTYLIKKVKADQSYFCDLINCIFQWALQQKEIKTKREYVEHLNLKYISFLYKFYGNSPRAYYELKLYLSKKVGSSSYYFVMIAKVISSTVENQIDWRRTGSKDTQKGLSFSQKNQELTVYTVLAIDQICEKYIPQIISCVQWKIEFWERLLLGYNSMDNFQVKCLELATRIDKMNYQFHFKLRQINNFVQQYDSYHLKKLKSMFYLLVMNDTLLSMRLEEECDELKNRDMLKNIELVHSSNFIKGNIQTVQISLAKNIGQIISKKDKKFMEFFGYEKEESDVLKKINDVMPNYLGKLHDRFLKHYIWRGSSSVIQNNFTSFIQNKTGYIQQVKLYIDYVFNSSNDFQMAATLLKINSAYDYMVFNRQGLIVGITQNLVQKLYSQLNKIPSTSQIINRYFSFLFFVDILKIFRAKKEEISKLVTNGETNIQLDSSKKGWFNLNETYEEVQTQFNNYLEYCRKNPKETNGFVNLEQLDLLNDETLDFLEQFQAFRLLQRNLGGSKPSNQSLSSRNLRNKLGFSTDTRSLRLYHIRLFFKYTIHLTQFDLHQKENFEKKECFFLLKFHDLTINKKIAGQKMKFTKSMITYLGATTSIGLLSQFGSQLSRMQTNQFTTSRDFQTLRQSMNSNSSSSKFKDIPFKMIASLIKLKTSSSSLIHQQEQSENKKNEEELDDNQNTSKQGEQPRKPSLKNLKNNILKNLFESKKNEIISNDKGKNKLFGQSLKENTSSNQGQATTTATRQSQYVENPIDEDEQENSVENLDDEQNNDDQDENDDEGAATVDNEEIDEEAQKEKEQQVNRLLSTINMNEEYQKSHTRQLTEQLLNKYTLSEDYMKGIDPNYHIKKVLQVNSRASSFSVALENAIIEAQIELMQEKRLLETVKTLISPKDNSGYSPDFTLHQQDTANLITNRYDSQILVPQQSKSESQFNLIKQDNQNFASKLQGQNAKRSQYDLNVKDAIKQKGQDKSSTTQDSPTLFKNSTSVELSPIPMSTKDQIGGGTTSNKKSQFLYNNTQNVTNDSIIKSMFDKNETSFMMDGDASPAPTAFRNPNEMAITFRESMQRVETPSLDHLDQNQHNDNESDVSSSEKKDKMSTKKVLHDAQQQVYDNKRNIVNDLLQDSTLEANENIEFKFQKSLDQQEDIDGQLEEIRTQKEKKKNFKEMAQYQQSHRSTKKTMVSMTQLNNIQMNLLKQKGLKDEEGNHHLFEGSVKSTSSSTRTRYGGVFLKEIIQTQRLPIAAKQYQLLLFVFLVAFITLNFINLSIITTSMTDFSNYVAVIRVPRQFQRQYSIALMGINSTLTAMAKTFVSQAYTAYAAQYVPNEQLMTSSWISISSDSYFQEPYVIYIDRVPQIQETALSMMYLSALTQLQFLQANQTKLQQLDAFLYLRQNYILFKDQIIVQVQTLVNKVSNTVDSLTNSFTSTSLSAIAALIVIGILFFPLVILMNRYQEQILMIISRIYKEQAEIERNKFSIIKQLVDYEKWDWLKYNYNGILWIKYEQFDLKNTQNRVKAAHEKRTNNPNKRSLNLQSLIFVQKLSIFKRIWHLELIILISIAYFAFIIIYIYMQNSILKFPVLKNFNTFNTHISLNNVKICGSIVAFDRYLANYIPGYNISNIQDYVTCLYQSMDDLSNEMSINSNMIYDLTNPFPAANRLIAKNLYEGNICGLVTQFPCLPNDITDTLGLSQIYTQLNKCLITFPSVFNYTDMNDLNDYQIKNFLNDDCSKLYFFQSFTRQDEVAHLFSSNINGSIATISNSIQTFLSQYLTILGVILSIAIAIILLANWLLLRRRLLLMNLILTIIPEEKLTEEITLNMLKQLRYQ